MSDPNESRTPVDLQSPSEMQVPVRDDHESCRADMRYVLADLAEDRATSERRLKRAERAESKLAAAERQIAQLTRERDDYLAGFGEYEFKFHAAEDRARQAIAEVRRWYDESIFPPRPPGRHTEVYDGEAAAVARKTCDNILAAYDRALSTTPEDPHGA